MKNNKGKLNYLLVIILLLLVSVGYAVLSTNLNIIGTSNINNPTWNIHWENVQVKTGSVSATTPTIDTAKTTVNYSVTFTIPGEYYEFTVDAVNAGTIDGMISVVSNKLNNVEITTLPNYFEYKVTYEDGVDIAPNHLLEASSSEKYKVHVGYKKDISSTDIPSSPQTLNLSFSVTYVQSDSNAVVLERPTIKQYMETTNSDIKSDTYRDNIKIINIGTQINPPNNVIESWDIGVDQNGNVMAYIVQNKDDITKYDLYIQGDGSLYANTNSSYLFYQLRGVEKINNLNLLNTSKTNDMSQMFFLTGRLANSFNMDVSNFDTSHVTSMYFMFASCGRNALSWSIGDLSNWDVSDVENMQYMFSHAGASATTWSIGDLSNWDTSNVTDMGAMFSHAGQEATTWNNIGIFNIYADKIGGMFNDCRAGSATLNIYTKPDIYSGSFYNAAIISGSEITVNYSSAVTSIDNIIATKSSNSNVVKGSLIT
ncbi:MAG: BspA family leucine-rich repeat surface protein [Bacilli bacterium]|nr:BspA family leucine-rich repeat surface protein [Bacilli bacterium]